MQGETRPHELEEAIKLGSASLAGRKEGCAITSPFKTSNYSEPQCDEMDEEIIARGEIYNEDGPTGRFWEIRRPVNPTEVTQASEEESTYSMGQTAIFNQQRDFSQTAGFIPKNLVGHGMVVQVNLNDQPCCALLDTGSTVSTISESWFKACLPGNPVYPLGDVLKVEGAGGHNLPYAGYTEARIAITGHQGNHPILLLVVPDTDYSSNVPLILGTNILGTMLQEEINIHGVRYLQRSSIRAPWKMVFQSLQSQARLLEKRKGRLCFIKVAGNHNVVIPGNSTMVLQGYTCDKLEHPTCLGMVQQSCTINGLPNVEVAPQLFTYSCQQTDPIAVTVSNSTNKAIKIPAQSVIGELQQVTEEMSGEEEEKLFQEESKDGDFLDKIDFESTALDEKLCQELKTFLLRWGDIFSHGDLDIGLTSLVKHRINLSNETPFKQRHRHIPSGVIEEVRQHLQQLLGCGVIRRSCSPWASNMVLVRKKDGTLRICVDYRELNKHTVKDSYALPRIDEMLETLGGSVYYTVLDMKSGYHQIEVEEQHKQRTAFTAGPLGFYEYNRLPFGLSNAPATYQRLMEDILGDLNHRICLVYLDDVIVFSKTFEEHLTRLGQVFQKCREAGLKLSPKKCTFCAKRVKYVGHIVSQDGIEPDPSKIDKIAQWSVPQNADDVRQFLGFAGYYRKFIDNFSKVARPLNDLLGGNGSKRKGKRKLVTEKPWCWADEQQEAFDTLKCLLTQPPILGYVRPNLPLELHVDASMDGLGAVLYQEQDKVKRVIAFGSRGLTKPEKNYSAFKLEFLALKWAITEKFKDYLYGVEFVVYTDNNPLTYIMTTAKLDAVGHRWLAALSPYNFSLKYRPGTSNRDADALSRLRGANQPLKEVSSDTIKVLQKAVGINGYIETMCFVTQIIPDQQDIMGMSTADWKQAQREDNSLGPLAHFVEKGQRPTRKQLENTPEIQPYSREMNRYVMKDGVMYRRRSLDDTIKLQLLLPKAYQEQAMKGLHDDMGHLGREKTLGLVQDRFYWPGMSKDVADRIQNCGRCLRRKTPTNVRAPLVSVNTSQPLELVCMDYLTLEMSKGGFQHMLVITDHFTRFAMAIPTRNQTAKTTAEALWKHFILYYGFPKRLHSDQAANFTGKVIKQLCAIAGMEKSRTTPYHPMGNGMCERFNRTLLNMLGTLEESQKADWKSYVSAMVHAYNCTKHESTGYSPFLLMFGREPRLPIDLVLGIDTAEGDQDYTQFISSLKEKLQKAYAVAASHAKQAQQNQKLNYDQKVRGAVVQIGDRVLVRTLAFTGKHKLADRWEPEAYEVLEQPNADLPVYVVQKENKTGARRTLHRNQLLPIGALPIIDAPGTEVVSKDKVTKNTSVRRTRQQKSPPSSEEETDSSSDGEEYYIVPCLDMGGTMEPADAESSNVSFEELQDGAELPGSGTQEPELTIHPEPESHCDIIDDVAMGDPGISAAETDNLENELEEIQTATPAPVPAPRRSTRSRMAPNWYGAWVHQQQMESPTPTPRKHNNLGQLDNYQLGFSEGYINTPVKMDKDYPPIGWMQKMKFLKDLARDLGSSDMSPHMQCVVTEAMMKLVEM